MTQYTQRTIRRVEVLANEMRLIHGDINVIKKLDKIANQEGFVEFIETVREKEAQVKKGLFRPEIADSERAFRTGYMAALDLILSNVGSQESRNHQVARLETQSKHLQSEIKRVQDEDSVWGQDPDIS